MKSQICFFVFSFICVITTSYASQPNSTGTPRPYVFPLPMTLYGGGVSAKQQSINNVIGSDAGESFGGLGYVDTTKNSFGGVFFEAGLKTINRLYVGVVGLYEYKQNFSCGFKHRSKKNKENNNTKNQVNKPYHTVELTAKIGFSYNKAMPFFLLGGGASFAKTQEKNTIPGTDLKCQEINHKKNINFIRAGVGGIYNVSKRFRLFGQLTGDFHSKTKLADSEPKIEDNITNKSSTNLKKGRLYRASLGVSMSFYPPT